MMSRLFPRHEKDKSVSFPEHKGEFIHCSQKGCKNKHKNNKWASIRATSEKGWMHQKNGDSWCPEHLPDWVESWRAEGKRLKEKYG